MLTWNFKNFKNGIELHHTFMGKILVICYYLLVFFLNFSLLLPQIKFHVFKWTCGEIWSLLPNDYNDLSLSSIFINSLVFFVLAFLFEFSIQDLPNIFSFIVCSPNQYSNIDFFSILKMFPKHWFLMFLLSLNLDFNYH